MFIIIKDIHQIAFTTDLDTHTNTYTPAQHTHTQSHKHTHTQTDLESVLVILELALARYTSRKANSIRNTPKQTKMFFHSKYLVEH